MSSKSRNSAAGFTLIEVLIAIFVMTFISLAIFRTITESFRLRDIILHDGDFYNSIRFSMDVFQRDVSQIYSPSLIAPSTEQTGAGDTGALIGGGGASRTGGIQPADDPTGELSQTFNFWGAAIDKTGIRPSRFIGTESKVTFIAVSHIRVYKDTRESEFAKITYEVKNDDVRREELARDQGEVGNLILVKTEDTNAFEMEEGRTKTVATYPLLPGIRSLRFRYYQKEKDTWHNSWDSDKEDFKNVFPDTISVTLEVLGPSRNQFEGTYFFRPEIPNNGILPNT